MWNNNSNWSGPGWVSFRKKTSGGGGNLPPDFSNLRVWLDTEDIDGSNNSTLTDGQMIASWINKGSLGGTFAQVTPGSQPKFALNGLNGKPGVDLDGNDYLESSLPSSAFIFMHDGSGSTIYTFARTASTAIQTLLATTVGTNTSVGFGHRVVTGPASSFFVINGTAAILNIVGGVPAVNNFHAQVSAVAAADTPDASLALDGTQVGTGNASGAFSTANPTNPLRLGTTAGSAFFFTGRVLPTLVFGVAHDAAMQASVIAWVQSKYGVTFPTP